MAAWDMSPLQSAVEHLSPPQLFDEFTNIPFRKVKMNIES